VSRYVSHADLGGQRGHGRVVPKPEGELFHAAWEPRALALTLAMGATGSWNIDMSRAARETLPDYGRLTYYEIWFAALAKLLAERALALPDELQAGRALHPAPPVARTLMAADVSAALAKGSPTLREALTQPRFAPGQAVRMHAGEVPHHTRLPRYVRGKCGTIERVLGAHVFADAHALGRGEDPRWLYTVVFRGSELWPRRADAGEAASIAVSVDAWEPYLEPA
jgi:nitrile hydratase beta subunit